MAEPQLLVENIPFVWGVLFTLDVVMGLLLFFCVMQNVFPEDFTKVAWFWGWMYWLDAITLLINATLGTSNPFSYHQFGIATGLLMDTGSLAFLVWYMVRSKQNDTK